MKDSYKSQLSTPKVRAKSTQQKNVSEVQNVRYIRLEECFMNLSQTGNICTRQRNQDHTVTLPRHFCVSHFTSSITGILRPKNQSFAPNFHLFLVYYFAILTFVVHIITKTHLGLFTLLPFLPIHTDLTPIYPRHTSP